MTLPTSGNNWTRTTTQTAPDSSTTVTVEQYGRLVSVTRYNASGGQVTQTSYGYDAHGRQAAVTDARSGTTMYTFNAADQVQTTTSPDPGNGTGPQTTANTFDNMGRVIAVQNPDGNTVSYLYLTNGLLKRVSGSRTYPVEYSYDAQGRMRTNKTWQSFSAGTGAAITRWNYDPHRGWLKSKDYPDKDSGVPPVAEGTSGPLYTYTPGGRLSSRIWLRPGVGGAALITTNKYGFNDGAGGNEHGDLVSVQYLNDPAPTPTVTYSYDRRGRRTQVVRDGMTTSFGYNDASEQTGESYSGGVLGGLSVNATYNNLLQRDSLSLGGVAGYSVSYGYDNASRLAAIADSASLIGYSYLANSPLVSQIFFTNSGSLRMTTTKQFDRLNRLSSISSSSSSSSSIGYSYVYNSANQRIRATLADGSYWLYSYDYLGQVTSGKRYWLDGTPVAGQQFEYGFDDIGNRKSTGVGGDASGGGLRGDSYTPNRLNQYSSRTVNGAVDQIGIANPTASVTVNGYLAYRKGEYFDYALPVSNGSAPQYPLVIVVSSYPPGQTNQGNIFVPQTPESFGYDADGNLMSDGRWSYALDAENRLVKVESLPNAPTGSKRRLEFTYDHQSRRIKSKITNLDTGVVTSENKFLYDGWNLLAELNATNNAIIRSFVWGLDLSGSMQGAGGVGALLKVTYNGASTTNCFAAYDGNGNVMALVKADGASLCARYHYGPFGEVVRATGPMAKANPFRFSTKYQDDETDLLYYGYRCYSASTGRWLNRDDIEEAGGLNMYGFVENDPIAAIDLLGRINPHQLDPYNPPLAGSPCCGPCQRRPCVIGADFAGIKDTGSKPGMFRLAVSGFHRQGCCPNWQLRWTSCIRANSALGGTIAECNDSTTCNFDPGFGPNVRGAHGWSSCGRDT
ncbi:MAG TPA: RHS repeat-associated core domain-containing protein [Verrucomicrobiae bacterium]